MAFKGKLTVAYEKLRNYTDLNRKNKRVKTDVEYSFT